MVPKLINLGINDKGGFHPTGEMANIDEDIFIISFFYFVAEGAGPLGCWYNIS